MLRSFLQHNREKRSGHRRRKLSALRPELLEQRQLLSAVTVQVPASQDNTLYETGLGNLSNGRGEYVVVGGEGSDELARRGLLQFDLTTSRIPPGSVILDVTLTLNLAYSYGAATDIQLFRMLSGWGEAGSNAPGNEVDGALAEQFDATWLFSYYPGSAWSTPGGDRLQAASAAVQVEQPGAYQWIGEGLIEDVQHWLDSSSQNFGWMLMAQQIPGSMKAFESRDSTNSVLRPTLEITYETAILPTIIAGRSWSDSNGDGLRMPPSIVELQLTFHQGRNLFNLYGGNEYWYRSGVDGSWYFLTDTGQLSRWDGQVFRLTGEVVETLDVRSWYNPSSLLAGSGTTAEPYLNGIMFQLLDEQGSVVATTISGDRDLNRDGIINPETERGWYQFDVDIPGQYSIRAIPSSGLVESATPDSARAAEVFQLKDSLGLHFLNSYYENVGFRGERWLKAEQGWVYITPAGDLYRWSGRSGTASNPVAGTWLANLGQAYHQDPSLIFRATAPGFQIQDETAVSAAAFGFYRPAVISGRSWNDMNGDGIRSPESFATAEQINRPAGAPIGNFLWFQVTDQGASGTPGAVTYFYVSGTQVYQWEPSGNSLFMTQIWGGAATSAETIREAFFTVEEWLNGTTYELRDAKGYLISTQVTTNIDLNNDGQIDPAQESGWYSFAGLLPGTYTIREVGRSGWLPSTPIATSSLLQQAQSPLLNLNFKAAPNDWYNFGGRHERWFLGEQNAWFFIIPNGTIFKWDMNSGGAHGLAKGTQYGRLSGSFYVNLALLFDPKGSTTPVIAGQQLTNVHFGTLKVIDSLFSDLHSELLAP